MKPRIRRIEEALPLFRQVEALAIYEKIPDPYSVGATHHRLALIAADDADREAHLQSAREAWASIDRQDLIEKHLDNFLQPRPFRSPRRWLWWVFVALVLYVIAHGYLAPWFEQWLSPKTTNNQSCPRGVSGSTGYSTTTFPNIVEISRRRHAKGYSVCNSQSV